MSIKNLHLGLCCINTELRHSKPSIFPNRTCRLNTANNKGLKYVQDLALQNVQDVIKMMIWNYENGIHSYRLSSDMFPHAGNPRYGKDRKKGPRYSLKFAKKVLRKIGKLAFHLKQRLSMHPGQYNQIASPSENVFQNTILDLSMHTRILDMIEKKHNFGENRAIICIHGGGVYGNKEATIQRWLERFPLLPENVRSRIALENCEKCYSTEDCLRICEALNIPMIFDHHHYKCYSILHPNEEQKSIKTLMPRILKTWERRGLKPYFHLSEQGSGKIGHHSDFITKIPKCFFKIGVKATLDIEAKAKEQAILQLVKKYAGKASYNELTNSAKKSP